MTLHSGFDIWLCDKMSWGSSMVHLQAIASHLSDTPMMVYGGQVGSLQRQVAFFHIPLIFSHSSFKID